MSDIDWKAIAKANNLTPEEFKTEIFMTALAIGLVELDEHKCNEMKFTVSEGSLTIKQPVNKKPPTLDNKEKEA